MRIYIPWDKQGEKPQTRDPMTGSPDWSNPNQLNNNSPGQNNGPWIPVTDHLTLCN